MECKIETELALNDVFAIGHHESMNDETDSIPMKMLTCLSLVIFLDTFV